VSICFFLLQQEAEPGAFLHQLYLWEDGCPGTVSRVLVGCLLVGNSSQAGKAGEEVPAQFCTLLG